MVKARASRPNKQRAFKPSMHLAFSWRTSKLRTFILWNARVTVSWSCSCLERVRPVGQIRVAESVDLDTGGARF